MVTDALPATAAANVARLDATGSHRAFRSLLDAFARPGTIADLGSLAADLDVDPTLIPVLALADLEVVVAVIDDPDRADEIASLLRRSTAARITDEPSEADMVLVTGDVAAAEIALVRRGDAAHPELGAHLILRVDHLGDVATSGPDCREIRISGPGARMGRIVAVAGFDPAIVAALQRANADHPAGFDTWLVDGAGNVIGIPRSNRVEIVEGAD